MSNAYGDFAKAFASATASQFASIARVVRACLFSEQNGLETSINDALEAWVDGLESCAAKFTGSISNQFSKMLPKVQPRPLPPFDADKRTRAINNKMNANALGKSRLLREFTSRLERRLHDLGAPQYIWMPPNGNCVLTIATDFYEDVINTGYTTLGKAVSLTLQQPLASHSIPVTLFQLFADAMASYAEQRSDLFNMFEQRGVFMDSICIALDQLRLDIPHFDSTEFVSLHEVVSLEEFIIKQMAKGVRKLILEHYFTNVSTIGRVFVDVDKKILPNAMEWIGRDGLGFSAMYHLVRGNPLLFQQ